MNSLKEADFHFIKFNTSYRLGPDASAGFLFMLLVFGSIITFLPSYLAAFSYPEFEGTFFKKVAQINLVILFIHIMVMAFFFSTKRAFKYQKIQSAFLAFFVLKMSMDMYIMFFYLCVFLDAPSRFTYAGLTALLLGAVWYLIFFIRAILRLKNGELRENGRGYLNMVQTRIERDFFYILLL